MGSPMGEFPCSDDSLNIGKGVGRGDAKVAQQAESEQGSESKTKYFANSYVLIYVFCYVWMVLGCLGVC